MSVEKIGINFSNFENLPQIDFNISNTTSGFINDIPIKANQYTQNFLGIILPIGLFVFLYYILSDKSQIGQFGYSTLRALGISSGIVGIIGMFMLNVGWFTQVYPIVFFITIFMIAFIFVVREE